MRKRIDRAASERYRQEHNRCLGEAVRELRTDKGLSLREVAKRANVSILWLKRLETNQLRTNYTIRRLDQVAGALEVELFDLFKRAGQMAGPAPWLETKGTHNGE